MRVFQGLPTTGLQRVAGLAVLSLLAVLWVAVAWERQDGERKALDEVRRETATLALLFANETDNTFRNADQALLALRRTWVNNPANVASVAKEYEAFLEGAILQIGIIGADGNAVYSTLGTPKQPTYLGEREHFKVHQGGLQDTLFVSRPQKGVVSGKWSIHLSRPVFRNAQWVGVVVISVDPNHFVKFYQNAGMGKDGSARMIRDTGEIMARATDQDKYVGKVIDASRYATPGAPLRGSFRAKAQTDGVERLSSYHRLPQYGLTVVVGPGLEERLTPLRSYQRQILGAAGLVTVLVLLVAWLLTRAAVRKVAVHREQAAAAATLHASEARFHAMFDHAVVGIAQVEPVTGRFLKANQVFAQFTGHTPMELETMTFSLITHPGEAVLGAAALQQLADRSIENLTVEKRCTHKLGHAVWGALSVSAVFDAQGKHDYFIAVVNDITARKQAEDALQLTLLELQASHNHLVKLSHNVPGALYQYQLFPDGSACFPFASEGIWDVYEVTPKQACQNAEAVIARLHPDDLQTVSAAINASAHTLQVWQSEYRVILPQQGLRWLAGTAQPERLADGSTLWHGFITDVTERKQAQAALLEFNRNFESFLHQTSDFVYFKDRDSRFRFCSQTMAKLTGHAHWHEMIGKHDTDVFPADVAQVYQEEEAPVFNHGKPLLNIIAPYYRADGSPGSIETNKWPLIDEAGHIVGLFGISRDVTDRELAAVKLLDSETRFRHLFEKNTSVMLIVEPASGTIVAANPSALAYYGHAAEQLVGAPIGLLNTMTPDAIAKERQLALHQRHNRVNFQHRLASGEVRDVEVYATPIEQSGKPLLFSIVHDVTERKRMELALARSEHQYRTLIDVSPVPYALNDAAHNVVLLNAAFVQTFGYTIEDVPTLADWWPKAYPEPQYRQWVAAKWQANLDKAAQDGTAFEAFEITVHGKDGTQRTAMASATQLSTEHDDLQLVVLYDITERKQQQDQIMHMAQHDSLTGLANRALFNDRLQRALASARRDKTSLALMFIDLDKFKPVNDQFGHAVGDLLLQHVAQRMQACVRESDTLARVGGDEFVVVLRDVAGEPEALAVAEKIRASLAQPFVLNGHNLGIGCCVGVALYPQHGADDVALSLNADHAMYQAKERGRNQVVLYQATRLPSQP